jgi:hypothetical protein
LGLGALRLKDPLKCARVIKCCALLHNFIIENSAPEDLEIVNVDDIEGCIFVGIEEEEEEDVQNQEIQNPFMTPEFQAIYQTFCSANSL